MIALLLIPAVLMAGLVNMVERLFAWLVGE